MPRVRSTSSSYFVFVCFLSFIDINNFKFNFIVFPLFLCWFNFGINFIQNVVRNSLDMSYLKFTHFIFDLVLTSRVHNAYTCPRRSYPPPKGCLPLAVPEFTFIISMSNIYVFKLQSFFNFYRLFLLNTYICFLHSHCVFVLLAVLHTEFVSKC